MHVQRVGRHALLVAPSVSSHLMLKHCKDVFGIDVQSLELPLENCQSAPSFSDKFAYEPHILHLSPRDSSVWCVHIEMRITMLVNNIIISLFRSYL